MRRRFVREESEAIGAFLGRRRFSGMRLQVELRGPEATTHPLSGEPISAPPIAVLWHRECLVAVSVHDVVAINQTAERSIREMVADEAHAHRRPLEPLPESRLWQVLSPARQ